MAKVLVLYYSMYGHIETMAHAVAEGANRVDGVEVVVKRVPETMQAEAFAKAGGKHKTPRSPPRRSSRTMMPLSSAPRPASAICPARCAPSSTRRAGSGLRRVIRQAGQRVQLYRHGRRPGADDHLHLDYSCPSWDGDCADWLRRTGTVRCFAGSWRDTVWCDHHCRWRWFTSAKQ